MLLNTPLIETASSDDELSPGFIDNSMMLAISDTLADCHSKLKNMMAHHSVQIYVRYVDNTMTLYRLRRPSGRLLDYT
jgi:hypothetical protein